MAQQIVVGVDGSDTSLDALGAAVDLAEQTGSQLSVVFVRDPGLTEAAPTAEPAGASAGEQTVRDLEAGARRRTSDALRDTQVAWTFDSATGDVTHELENVAQRRDAPLIIVGGHHRAGVGIGSVAQQLVRDLPVSVLVIGRAAPSTHRSGGPDEDRAQKESKDSSVGFIVGSHRDRRRPGRGDREAER
jgi:nucleotide-binding universal stress UspA family protein